MSNLECEGSELDCTFTTQWFFDVGFVAMNHVNTTRLLKYWVFSVLVDFKGRHFSPTPSLPPAPPFPLSSSSPPLLQLLPSCPRHYYLELYYSLARCEPKKHSHTYANAHNKKPKFLGQGTWLSKCNSAR